MKDFEKRFRLFGIATITAVFFLIFVGGLVRSTGSGMGCPDWPKCFGTWLPPTDVSQLPDDYKTKFAVHGKEIAEFNVYKTWTEYLNRWAGVVIGIFVFLTLIFSFPYLKKDKKVFWLSLLTFLLVGLEGWIGKKVVDTELKDWMVTIHMIIALIIVGLLIYTITRSQSFFIEQKKRDSSLKIFAILLLASGFIQIISGTQVRENVDSIASVLGDQNRQHWSNYLIETVLFKYHRSWSIIGFGIAVVLIFIYRKLFDRNSLIYKSGLALILLMSIQVLCGSALVNLGFSKYLQSFHLTLGSLTAGLEIFTTILIFSKTKIIAD